MPPSNYADDKKFDIPHPAVEPDSHQPAKFRRVLRRCTYIAIVLLGLHVIVHGYWTRDYDLTQVHEHHLSTKEREKLFLSVPSPNRARAVSRAYAGHPHLAGSPGDFGDARTFLKLFQTEFSITPPSKEPIFSAGTPESRKATLGITSRDSTKPTAWIDTYYPLLNTPLDRSLQILGEDGEAVWNADLNEDGDPRDEDAHKFKDAIPPWHGLSKDGEAQGQLVYANYGSKEDYDALVAAGTDLTGKIVIARYGNNFRGLKIKRAQELGAVGVLIYSDTRDDGFVTVENGFAPYPAGPARNPTSVQRGSVQFLSSYPGDPTTPGYPSYQNAERQEATNIPSIPSLPISWQNGQRLLEEIGEPYIVRKDGRKILSGKVSTSMIKIVNHVDTKITPIWNAMAAIPGHIRDEVVVVGNHRDAWVLGAADPTSGAVSLHEIVRGFGALLRKGWKPLRTIVIASWDAEEYGLVGSTEWGEDFPEWLSQHAVAYLNLDTATSGSRWLAEASPSLAHLIEQTARDVPHPTMRGRTLWDARNDQGPFRGVEGSLSSPFIDADFLESCNATKRRLYASSTDISPLGSGSDYTVFLQRLGVASANQGFGGTPTDAAYHYHSIYDSEHFQEVFADPDFTRHVAIAQHLGLLALRLTDSIIIPLNTTQYALELEDYLAQVEALEDLLPSTLTPLDLSKLKKAIKEVERSSRALDKEKEKAEKNFKRALHKLLHHHHGRTLHGLIQRTFDWFFDTTPLQCQLDLSPKADIWEKLWYTSRDEDNLHTFPLVEHRHGHGHKRIKELIKAAKRVKKVNQKLISFERGFISKGGLKDRDWFKHLGVAPGKWLGYGATTFPGVTEALTIDHDVAEAQHEAKRLTKLLKRLANDIAP